MPQIVKIYPGAGSVAGATVAGSNKSVFCVIRNYERAYTYLAVIACKVNVDI